jgi:hypothetical protein
VRRWIPVLAFVAITGACSLGDGVGSVTGELNLPDCWEGAFNLQPTFFAAAAYPQQPYQNQPQSLTIRIQNGGNFETFSDGVAILIDSIAQVRGDPASGYPGELGQSLKVALPPGVTPPGVPIVVVPNPPLVHMTMYLQLTCHTQLDALYAVDQVSLNSQGACAAEPAPGSDGGAPADAAAPPPLPLQCGATGTTPASPDGGTPPPADASVDSAPPPAADAASPAPPPAAPAHTGTSSITFTHLFDGLADESDAAQRLNEGTFDVYLADPREICPGGAAAGSPPPPCRAHITGNFKFYFERGRPAQPFP